MELSALKRILMQKRVLLTHHGNVDEAETITNDFSEVKAWVAQVKVELHKIY